MSEDIEEKARRTGSCPRCGSACHARDAELVRGKVWTRCPSCLEMFEGTWSNELPAVDPTKFVMERPPELSEAADTEKTRMMIALARTRDSSEGPPTRNTSEELTPIVVPTRIAEYARSTARQSSMPPRRHAKIPRSARAVGAPPREVHRSSPKKRRLPPPLPEAARGASSPAFPKTMAKVEKELSIPLPILRAVVTPDDAPSEGLTLTPTEFATPAEMERLARPSTPKAAFVPEPSNVSPDGRSARPVGAMLRRPLRLCAMVFAAALVQVVMGGLALEAMHRVVGASWWPFAASTQLTSAAYSSTTPSIEPVAPAVRPPAARTSVERGGQEAAPPEGIAR